VIDLDDYHYSGIDFKGDIDMFLPPSSTYGDIGMSKFLNISFFCIFL
jgi:hypothetical protein